MRARRHHARFRVCRPRRFHCDRYHRGSRDIHGGVYPESQDESRRHARGVGGLAGAVLTGFFAEKAINAAGNNGALFGNPDQVIVQILAVAATATYAFVATYVLLKVISFFSPLRVESHEEEEGLDMATHGESAYRH